MEMYHLGGIELKTASSHALVVPQMGANCVALHIGDMDVLRTPSSDEELQNAPYVYGVPLLFPPNRIHGAAFSFGGRTYRFPLNEPARGNHLHGSLARTPFTVVQRVCEANEDMVELEYRATEENPYASYPQAFSIKRKWTLMPDALVQKLSVCNDGTEAMPVGVGFHTAFNVCFDKEDLCAEHYKLRMSATEEIVCDPETICPTGERRANTAFLEQLNGEGVAVQGTLISCHMKRGNGGAEFVHVPSGRSICFTVSDTLPYWMLWNKDGQSGFICPEPQSWIVDAPNQSQDTAKSGFRVIAPKECFVAETCIRLATAL